MYERCKVRVAEELKKWEYCALAVDGWSDHQSMETVCCTALQLGLPTRPLLVEMEQQKCRQTAVNLKAFLERAIEKVEAITMQPHLECIQIQI